MKEAMDMTNRGKGPEYPKSEAELRVQLAACYRLVAHFGMDDLIYNHISARVPGESEHFLINPYGLYFREITASSLVKIDVEGNQVGGSNDAEVNRAGFVIHAAIHKARADARCVLHTHSDAATAVSALKEGLLPMSQFAMHFYNRVGVHDYEGVALDLDEQARLAADLGRHRVLLLRNHGVLTVGQTVPEAFMLVYYFERAARVQLAAQAATAQRGEALHLPPPEVCERTARQFTELQGDIAWPGSREWPGFLRLLDSLDPSYRN
jgi:ribulose-5-phosphate 4-epimerase/fuculose-1-phosphate aldolase